MQRLYFTFEKHNFISDCFQSSLIVLLLCGFIAVVVELVTAVILDIDPDNLMS